MIINIWGNRGSKLESLIIMIILTYKKYKLSHTLEFVDIMSPSLLIYQSENFLSFNLYILYFSKLNDFMPIPFHGLLSLLKHEWLNSSIK